MKATDQIISIGYIKLHRAIRKHWIYENPEFLKWWIDILLDCNYTDDRRRIGLQWVECKRGQTIKSLKHWSSAWRITRNRVRRFFALLESDGMIVTENLGITTRLTVCNYDTYNETRYSNGHPKGSKSKKSGTAVGTRVVQQSVHLPNLFTDGYDKEQNSNASQMVHQTDFAENNSDPRDNKFKNIKESREGGDKPPPPITTSPANDYTEDEKAAFSRFQEWIYQHAKDVAKLKEPFTIDQFLKISKQYTPGFIRNLLKAMHNKADLSKKYRSAYLTFLNWAKRENKKTVPLYSSDKTQSEDLNPLSQKIKQDLEAVGVMTSC